MNMFSCLFLVCFLPDFLSHMCVIGFEWGSSTIKIENRGEGEWNYTEIWRNKNSRRHTETTWKQTATVKTLFTALCIAFIRGTMASSVISDAIGGEPFKIWLWKKEVLNIWFLRMRQIRRRWWCYRKLSERYRGCVKRVSIKIYHFWTCRSTKKKQQNQTLNKSGWDNKIPTKPRKNIRKR